MITYFEFNKKYSEKEARTIFLLLTKKYHPDLEGGSSEIQKVINNDFETIKLKGYLPDKPFNSLRPVYIKPGRAYNNGTLKFYEFIKKDTTHVNLPREAFEKGCVLNMMTPLGKEVRIHMKENSSSPVSATIQSGWFTYTIIAQEREMDRT